VETLDGYLTALASSAATPGGGSAAAVVAASGAALLSMVGRIYSESPKYAPYHELVTRIISSADALRFSSQLMTVPNKNLMSDIGCAAEFAYAGLAACGYNVRINHRYMRDADTIAKQSTLLARYDDEGRTLLAAVRGTVGEALAR
jgi:formiminotetrahydrofolate cyclodeaminase